MNEVCLFCQKPDKSYKPGRGVEFVCSICVIVLAGTEQGELKLAYKKAKELVSMRQMRALESFIEEETDEQIRPNIKSLSNRKRNSRVFRAKKRTTRRVKKKERIAVYSD
jgi:hypothetical protein